MNDPFDITAEEFVRTLESDELGGAMVIDVREPMEWNYYHLEESVLIPMNTIPGRMKELPHDRMMYVICAHGVRSDAVCRFLIKQGYGNIRNVEGGMSAVAALKGFMYD